jgi:hypothetical protein
MAGGGGPRQVVRFDDILACARLADELHRRGQRYLAKRYLANSMIEAMYCLLAERHNVVSIPDKKLKPPLLELVMNDEP